jgi:hypothetical protein
MDSAAWVALFQRIPVSYHDNVVVVMGTGAEVVLQTIAAMEPEYMVVRGRSAGSTDSGRVFVVPYAQIDYLSFIQRISEPELKTLFGGDLPAFATIAPPTELEATPEIAAPPAPPEPPPSAPAADPAAKLPPQVSKTVLLARLRARLGGDSKKAER